MLGNGYFMLLFNPGHLLSRVNTPQCLCMIKKTNIQIFKKHVNCNAKQKRKQIRSDANLKLVFYNYSKANRELTALNRIKLCQQFTKGRNTLAVSQSMTMYLSCYCHTITCTAME